MRQRPGLEGIEDMVGRGFNYRTRVSLPHDRLVGSFGITLTEFRNLTNKIGVLRRREYRGRK